MQQSHQQLLKISWCVRQDSLSQGLVIHLLELLLDCLKVNLRRWKKRLGTTIFPVWSTTEIGFLCLAQIAQEKEGSYGFHLQFSSCYCAPQSCPNIGNARDKLCWLQCLQGAEELLAPEAVCLMLPPPGYVPVSASFTPRNRKRRGNSRGILKKRIVVAWSVADALRSSSPTSSPYFTSNSGVGETTGMSGWTDVNSHCQSTWRDCFNLTPLTTVGWLWWFFRALLSLYFKLIFIVNFKFT